MVVSTSDQKKEGQLRRKKGQSDLISKKGQTLQMRACHNKALQTWRSSEGPLKGIRS